MVSKNTGGESRRERKKRETRRRILRAVELHFSSSGYDGSTVEMIAESAGVSKPTLFNYFPSKQALLHALIPAMDLRFAQAVDRSRVEDGSAATQIQRFFDYIAGTALDSPPMARTLMLQFLRAYENPGKDLEHHRFPLLRNRMEQLLQDGMDGGEVRRDLSPARLYQYITGVYVYSMLHWLEDPSYSMETELRMASSFIQSALLDSHNANTKVIPAKRKSAVRAKG